MCFFYWENLTTQLTLLFTPKWCIAGIAPLSAPLARLKSCCLTVDCLCIYANYNSLFVGISDDLFPVNFLIYNLVWLDSVISLVTVSNWILKIISLYILHQRCILLFCHSDLTYSHKCNDFKEKLSFLSSFQIESTIQKVVMYFWSTSLT